MLTKRGNKIMKLKNELIKILVSLITLIIILKIVFYNETLSNILGISFSLFWLFFVPGYSIMSYWRNKISFLEILVISFLLGLGIMGLLGYYLGLLGLHNKYHIYLPILFLAFLAFKFYKNSKKSHDSWNKY